MLPDDIINGKNSSKELIAINKKTNSSVIALRKVIKKDVKRYGIVGFNNSKNLKINKIHGKHLSYNNYNDIFSALAISKTLPKNIGTTIVKHANPCGVSILKNKLDSYKAALACDPLSAFGGIVSCNFKITKSVALELNKIFLEVVVANGFDKDSLKILKSKVHLF